MEKISANILKLLNAPDYWRKPIDDWNLTSWHEYYTCKYPKSTKHEANNSLAKDLTIIVNKHSTKSSFYQKGILMQRELRTSKTLFYYKTEDDENTVDDRAKKRPRPTEKPSISKGAKRLFPPLIVKKLADSKAKIKHLESQNAKLEDGSVEIKATQETSIINSTNYRLIAEKVIWFDLLEKDKYAPLFNLYKEHSSKAAELELLKDKIQTLHEEIKMKDQKVGISESV
ncbi:15317_t:CDS:2, partial [Gigaspora margarita]